MQDEIEDKEDNGGNTYNEKIELDMAVEDLQDRIKQALSKDKKSEPKKDEPFNLTDDSIDSLKDKYQNVRVIMPGEKAKIKSDLIDKLDREQLEKLGNSDVRHVSKMARIHLKKIDSGEVAGPEKDSGRPKDSTGGRAGNPQVNKEVRQKAKDLGVHPNNLGRKEYEKRMSQAAVQALTDSNFHSEARKLIAVLEDKPEWAKDPNQDPNKPDIFTPEYEKWQKTSVYSSDLYDSSPGTDEIGQFASQEAGYNGVEALDAIAFDLKMNGSKQLAAKLQSAIEDTNESSTKLGRLLPEQNRIHEGTRSQVGIIDRSGKIASGYVHYDGYPSNMKKGLKKHMKNEKDVLNLIKKGGARGIYNNKDIEYFNEKPSPLKGNFKDIEKYIKSADMRGGAEYVYLYNMKDKKWYFADTYTDKDLKKLF
jgi:hypothetical protein